MSNNQGCVSGEDLGAQQVVVEGKEKVFLLAGLD